jgi:hypothetical protein
MPELREFSAEPLIFMFRPTHYEVLTDDRVAEWEALVAERVGLKIESPRGTLSKSYCATPGAGPERDAGCDCDELR